MGPMPDPRPGRPTAEGRARYPAGRMEAGGRAEYPTVCAAAGGGARSPTGYGVAARWPAAVGNVMNLGG
jgi:hypothetical protein